MINLFHLSYYALRHRKPFVVSGILKLIHSLLQFPPSMIMTRLLMMIESGSYAASRTHGYLLALALFSSLLAKTIAENYYTYMSTNIGINVRGVLCSAIFRKALCLSPESRQNLTVRASSLICQHIHRQININNIFF